VKNDPRPWLWPEAGLALAIVFAYAASDELHQVFVPTRTPLVSDVLIDTSGGAVALLLLWLRRKIFQAGLPMNRPLAAVVFAYAAGLLLAQVFQPPLAVLFGVPFSSSSSPSSLKSSAGFLIWPLLALVGWTNFIAHTAVISPDDLRVRLGQEPALCHRPRHACRNAAPENCRTRRIGKNGTASPASAPRNPAGG